MNQSEQGQRRGLESCCSHPRRSRCPDFRVGIFATRNFDRSRFLRHNYNRGCPFYSSTSSWNPPILSPWTLYGMQTKMYSLLATCFKMECIIYSLDFLFSFFSKSGLCINSVSCCWIDVSLCWFHIVLVALCIFFIECIKYWFTFQSISKIP